MFTGNKRKIIYLLFILVVGASPYVFYLWNSEDMSTTIKRLMLENTAMKNSLHSANKNSVTENETYVIWDYAVNLAESFPHLKIEAVTRPPVSASDGSAYWWGKCEGNIRQLLTFANHIKAINNFHIHSFSQKDGKGILLFFIVGESQSKQRV